MKSLKHRLITGLMLMSAVVVNSGCDVTLGPKTKTEYHVVHAGKPFQALDNKTLKGKTLEGTGDAVEQNVDGWVFMPPDHWDLIKRMLDKKPTEAQKCESETYSFWQHCFSPAATIAKESAATNASPLPGRAQLKSWIARVVEGPM